MIERDFVAEAKSRVLIDLGQIDAESKKALKRAVRRGELVSWRGHFYPVAGASFGMGPLKTCYAAPQVAAMRY